jgi:hypothetical protein
MPDWNQTAVSGLCGAFARFDAEHGDPVRCGQDLADSAVVIDQIDGPVSHVRKLQWAWWTSAASG